MFLNGNHFLCLRVYILACLSAARQISSSSLGSQCLSCNQSGDSASYVEVGSGAMRATGARSGARSGASYRYF